MNTLPDDLLAFVRASLPNSPARILEVGAGEGQLAATLAGLGYDVLPIDPAPGAPNVHAVSLHEVEQPDGSFDAAVAVLSLHHVEPLAQSCEVLARLVRPGGTLVIDEFDVSSFDQRAARWLIGQRRALGRDDAEDPSAMVAARLEHLHPTARLLEALSPSFIFGQPVRGAYLHRWNLDPRLRSAEEHLIATGQLPATGARLVGVRAEA